MHDSLLTPVLTQELKNIFANYLLPNMTLCFLHFFPDEKLKEADHYAPAIPLINLLILNKIQLLETW